MSDVILLFVVLVLVILCVIEESRCPSLDINPTTILVDCFRCSTPVRVHLHQSTGFPHVNLCPNCHSQTPDWRSRKSYR